MFDGWESGYGCVRRELAELAEYRRVFGKKSVKNWGTRECPGLTLNLKKFDTGSAGVLLSSFPINGAVTRAMLDCLSNREACAPCMLPVLVSRQQIVQTHVYIYKGKSVLDPQAGLTQRAAMVGSASGACGASFD